MEQLVEKIREAMGRPCYELETKEFQDEHLRMYPAISIRRTNFSVDEYETIANNLIDQINSGESIAEAARGLVALAYNTLVDNNTSEWSEDNLFFCKYDSMMTEDWLNISGESDLDLSSFLNRSRASEKKLELLDLEATDYERMAAIGSWAFSHLRAIGNSWIVGQVDFYTQKEGFDRSFKYAYGFANPYKIPVFAWDEYKKLSKIILGKEGEIKFLLFKSMIMYEKVLEQKITDPQKRILKGLAFESECCLRDHGLDLYYKSLSVAEYLEISLDELCDDLMEALGKPPLGEFATFDINAVQYVKHFHDWQSKQTTQYYRYARLLDRQYFYSLDQRRNQVLISALSFVFNWNNDASRLMDNKTKDPWRQWGQEIARLVREKRSISKKEPLNFTDSDLSEYPVLEIEKIDLSAEDCELIANRIIEAINSGEDESISRATLGLCTLAYNALMEPSSSFQTQRPFFHKYSLTEFNENWLQIGGKSKFDIRQEFLNEDPSIQSAGLKLKESGASSLQRKTCIGAWAFYHLRLLRKVNGSEWTMRFQEDFDKKFREHLTEVYGYGNCYEYPKLSVSSVPSLNEEFMKKSGEVLFLLTRAMIIHEKIYSDREPRKKLLSELALGPPSDLRGLGLDMVRRFRTAAMLLRISYQELAEFLQEGIQSLERVSSAVKYREIKNVKYLLDIGTWRTTKTTQYYQYAKLFNDQYFVHIDKEYSQILNTILMEIYNQKNDRAIINQIQADRRSKELGLQVARSICARYPGRYPGGRNQANNYR